MKNKIYFIITVLFLLCVTATTTCFAAVNKYNVSQYKRITVKKGRKIKLVKNDMKNIKWKVSDKKIATINKKGVLKAKSCGKVKVTAKTDTGKKYICKITIKKKVKKATYKAIKTKWIQTNKDFVSFKVYNNSDECLMLVNPALQYWENGKWEYEHKKEPIIDSRPHIIILPNGKYKCEFSLENYDMTHKQYRIIFDGFKGSTYSKTALKFSVYAPFEFSIAR